MLAITGLKPHQHWITLPGQYSRKYSVVLLTNINTGKPGRMVTSDFIVDIANRDGQLQLNVTDRKTGRTSTIEVSGLQNQSTDF